MRIVVAVVLVLLVVGYGSLAARVAALEEQSRADRAALEQLQRTSVRCGLAARIAGQC
jgi:hypothetical protein